MEFVEGEQPRHHFSERENKVKMLRHVKAHETGLKTNGKVCLGVKTFACNCFFFVFVFCVKFSSVVRLFVNKETEK